MQPAFAVGIGDMFLAFLIFWGLFVYIVVRPAVKAVQQTADAPTTRPHVAWGKKRAANYILNRLKRGF